MKRRQDIDFEDCQFCEKGPLYVVNDLAEGYFYDGDEVFCDTCQKVVGTMFADETAHVVFEEKEGAR